MIEKPFNGNHFLIEKTIFLENHLMIEKPFNGNHFLIEKTIFLENHLMIEKPRFAFILVSISYSSYVLLL